MPLIRKLLGIWMLNKTVSSTTALFKRLLVSLVAIAIMTIFAAVLMVLLCAGLLWLAYVELTVHGLQPQAAIELLTGVVAFALIILVLYVRSHFRNIRKISTSFIHTQSAITYPLSHITDAFMDGLLQDQAPEPSL